VADALGNPVRLLVTPGQRGDVPFAAMLVEGLSPLAVVADTAYDATHFRARLALAGAEAVIPPSPSRALKPSYDAELYRERNLVERFFGRLKQNRRVATRYEKTARNHLSFALWASTLVLLR
jgi:transposase